MGTAADLIVPLIGSVGIGAVCVLLRVFSREDLRLFSKLVFTVAIPVSAFSFLAKAPLSVSLLGIAAGYFAGVTVVAAAAFWMARKVGGLTIQESGAATFATICGNALFLGLPIATSVPGWGTPFLTLIVCEGVFAFALGVALLSWPTTIADGETLAARLSAGAARGAFNAVVVAVLAGMIVSMSGLTVPGLALLDRFSAVSAPLGLFVLGGYLVVLLREAPRPPVKLMAGLLPLKLVVFPAVAGGVTWQLTADPTLATVAILFCGLPPAVASIVLAGAYGQFEDGTTAIVGTGTAIGLVLLMIFLGAALPR